MIKDIFQLEVNRCFSNYKNRVFIDHVNHFLTYCEVEKRANKIASWILNKGISKETFIGLLFENKPEFIITMMGVTKANCVFVPLDTNNPLSRIIGHISQTETAIIIADTLHAEKLKEFNLDIEIQLYRELVDNEKVKILQPENICRYSPEDKLYIYFSSGTTGNPKIILGKNISALHYFDWQNEEFKIDSGYRIAQVATSGFDAFLIDVFTAFFAGGTACIPENKDLIKSKEKLSEWINKSNINLIPCVPSIFRLINNKDASSRLYKSLKYVLMFGESIVPGELENWFTIFDNRTQLVNLYGSTETTILDTFYKISRDDIQKNKIPAGKPIKGKRIIILDENNNVCDADVVGEIYIRSPYLTYGYYNNPSLNNSKFVQNPFNEKKELIYRTGDLGRILPDNNLELMGRADRMIKFNGARVELEEIENVLKKCELVEEAIVTKNVVLDKTEILSAYIKICTDHHPDNENLIHILKELLVSQLPEYMVPGNIIFLDSVPRKPNGKIDYSQLPNPLLNIEYIAPRDETEKRLHQLWAEITKINNIGVFTSFFNIGGNSISIMELVSKIHKEFHVELPINQIYINDTIEKQALIIRSSGRITFKNIKPVEKKEYYELSPAQRRLFIMHNLYPTSTAYNNNYIIPLLEKLDLLNIENVFKEIINRHEILRSSFVLNVDNPIQIVHSEVDFSVQDLYSTNSDVSKTIADFFSILNPEKAPLLRVAVLNIEDAKKMLLVNIHHIICDGLSVNILENEFYELYNEQPIPALKLQYKDYTDWLLKVKSKKIYKKYKSDLLKEFSGQIPRLLLPYDYDRPESKSFDGKRYYFNADQQESLALKSICNDEKVTMFTLMLALFNILLSKLSNQHDIILGAATEGREHSDLKNLIGMFVNTIPLRNFPEDEKTFLQFLNEVQHKTVYMLERQCYQFDDLIDDLNLDRNSNYNPLFDVMIGYQRITQAPDTLNPNKEFINVTSKFDLSLFVNENDENLYFSFEYSTKLFKEETIINFSRYFKEIINKIITNKKIRLNDIDILTSFSEVKSNQFLEDLIHF